MDIQQKLNMVRDVEMAFFLNDPVAVRRQRSWTKEQLEEMIAFASDFARYEAFLGILHEEIRQKRIKVAKENSWEQRTIQITEILQNYL